LMNLCLVEPSQNRILMMSKIGIGIDSNFEN